VPVSRKHEENVHHLFGRTRPQGVRTEHAGAKDVLLILYLSDYSSRGEK